MYSRLDLTYDGKSQAKLLENNADTPTSLYETGFWQWLWLEDCVNSGSISRHADQFNSLQEKLIQRFHNIGEHYGINNLHFACCKDTIEDRGTVQYLQDCAREAGLSNTFVFVEDIGLSQEGFFLINMIAPSIPYLNSILGSLCLKNPLALTLKVVRLIGLSRHGKQLSPTKRF